MKKLSRMLLVLLMSFALSACGNAATRGAAQPETEMGGDSGSVAAEESAITESAWEEAPSDSAMPPGSAGGEDGEAPSESAAPQESAGNKDGEAPPESAAPSGSAGDEDGGVPSGGEVSQENAGDKEDGAWLDESQDADGGPAEGGTEESVGSGEASSEGYEAEMETLPEDGTYTTKEDVALYIHLYGTLPSNFITKKEAEKLGWEGGSLEPFAPGKCIGGSRFGNYEGLLPEAEGRVYTECDIDTLGARKRGAKRIVFSNDGLIYYTEDHYESFELLYGEE